MPGFSPSSADCWDSVGCPPKRLNVEVAGGGTHADPGNLFVLHAVGLAYALFDFGVFDVGVVVAS